VHRTSRPAADSRCSHESIAVSTRAAAWYHHADQPATSSISTMDGSAIQGTRRRGSATGALPPAGTDDLWVFAYGSLMWRPDFAFAERLPALMPGWHRSLCVYSYLYRGTAERPGLVLGLAPGGSTRGIAYRVEAGAAAATLAYLRERELVHYVYRELVRPVRLADGRRVPALVYVADPHHAQYAGALDREARLAMVATCAGISGTNRDYVLNTLDHLNMLGVHDPELAWIARHLPPVTP
jgi:cation transport protein ChaC